MNRILHFDTKTKAAVITAAYASSFTDWIGYCFEINHKVMRLTFAIDLLIQKMDDRYFFKPVDLPGAILVGNTIDNFVHSKHFVN